MAFSVEILGMTDLQDLLRNMPGKITPKVMNDWTLRFARRLVAVARPLAPRRTQAQRARANRVRSSQLWRTIKASAVRRGLRRFPKSVVSRAIAYGARPKKNAGRTDGTPTNLFSWNVRGTVPRTQRTTGRYTGVMPSNSFWIRATNQVTTEARTDVNTSLRASYDRAIQAEVRRIVRRYG